MAVAAALQGREAIAAWLVERVASRVGLPTDQIALDVPFERYGLDSADAVELAGELGALLGRDLSETLLYDHASIARVADHLAEPAARPGARPARRTATEEPIAIVGVGCRYPSASGPEELWELLSAARDAVSEVPPARFDVDVLAGRATTPAPRYGAFLDDVAGFDARFFGISPREAVLIDPQHRLLLEVCHEAVEDAGESLSRLARSATGIFVGTGPSDYAQLLLALPELPDGYAATGTAASAAAGRVAHAFDLHGPSVAVDAACASSLYAVHLACRSLEAGECDVALAGGANAILIPEPTLLLDRLGLLAPDGRCKAFDAEADGYARGEGAGAVLLKPLSAAYRDGNPVYALIRGSAANSGGRTNGLSAPSGPAQEAVVAAALDRAGVRADRVDYVETQGTGTRLGDAVEARALSAVVGRGRSVGRHCAIGSVKTNLGHLEAAAGVASLHKVVLALWRGELVPSLNHRTPNPALRAPTCALRVQQERAEWPRAATPRVAGVSAFGFTGTNVHVVLEEAPPGLAPLGSR